jgi:hypothetical protein
MERDRFTLLSELDDGGIRAFMAQHEFLPLISIKGA